MFGFVVGALSLVGFIKVWKWGRRDRRYGGPREWLTSRLFQHLNTSQEQEKVLHEVLNSVETAGKSLRDTMNSSRSRLAAILRSEHFEPGAVAEIFEAQQAGIEEVKKAVAVGLESTHRTLVPEQRRRLAQLIESGPRGWRAGHGRACCGTSRRHGEVAL